MQLTFMKIFHLESFCNKSLLLKKILLLVISFLCLFKLSAQKENNLKLKIETGILWTSKSANPGFPWFNGFFLRVEPKLKTSKRTFIGLRIGVSENEKIENYIPLQFYSYNNPDNGLIQFTNPDNGIISIVPTIDYYFIENKLHPYFGGGVGYYFLTNFTEVTQTGIANPSETALEVSVKNRIGILLRGGLNIGKFIVGLEFNYIPKTDLKIPDGQIIGRVANSYVGLSFGYSFGIGKS